MNQEANNAKKNFDSLKGDLEKWIYANSSLVDSGIQINWEELERYCKKVLEGAYGKGNVELEVDREKRTINATIKPVDVIEVNFTVEREEKGND